MMDAANELTRQVADCLLGLVSGSVIHDTKRQESGYSSAKLLLFDDPENPIIVELSETGVVITNCGEGVLKQEESLYTNQVFDCLHSLLLKVSPIYTERFFARVSLKLQDFDARDNSDNEDFD